jgi:hypothetical protein
LPPRRLLKGKDSPAAAIQGAETTLPKLLAEVHQLRVVLQRATLANTRFQMAIERMRIQQAHVRSELANLEDAKAGTIDRPKDRRGALEARDRAGAAQPRGGSQTDQAGGGLHRA